MWFILVYYGGFINVYFMEVYRFISTEKSFTKINDLEGYHLF
jgi:hypothetical protein